MNDDQHKGMQGKIFESIGILKVLQTIRRMYWRWIQRFVRVIADYSAMFYGASSSPDRIA